MRNIMIPALVMLAANAVSDLRKREILPVPTCLFAGAGIALRIPENFLVEAVIPGAGLLILSAVTRGKIGAGDGLVLAALGIWTGFPAAALTCASGLFLASVYSLILLAGRSKRREIPFVPFLLAGYLLTCFH